MRVLYLNPCGQMGGAETSLLELLRSVRVAAPDWELWLVLGEDGPLAGKARDQGVQVNVVPFPRALARTGDVSPRTLSALCSLGVSAGSAAVLHVSTGCRYWPHPAGRDSHQWFQNACARGLEWTQRHARGLAYP